MPVGDPAALAAMARSMDVDVLLSGCTHQFEAYAYDGRFFINPGSATGAWTTDIPLPGTAQTKSPSPSLNHMATSKPDTTRLAAGTQDGVPPKTLDPLAQANMDMGTTPSFARMYAYRWY